MSPEPGPEFRLPFGAARVVREGSHLTLITWGMLVHKCLQAAQSLAVDGIEAEIIDLRTIYPLDMAAIIQSVTKTGRVLVAHEDTLTAGFGAEIAARIADTAFEHLDAPVRRLAALDSPVPYNSGLEAVMLPQTEEIIKTARELVAF